MGKYSSFNSLSVTMIGFLFVLLVFLISSSYSVPPPVADCAEGVTIEAHGIDNDHEHSYDSIFGVEYPLGGSVSHSKGH